MKTTRWGIIGPGKIAHQFAHDLSLVDARQSLHAVLGRKKESTSEFAKAFDVPHVFTDLEEFINKANVDIVYIATPHTLHRDEVLACLRRRIPVLVEKPMAINLDQCNELIAASRQYNTFLMEGMWIRFLPSVQQLLHILEKGEIGRILSVKASIGYRAPKDPSSRLFNPELGGGSLLDLGVYPIFLALLLLGKPDTIKAIGSLTEQGVDEDCSILFHYIGGQRATLECSLLSQSNSPAEIMGEKGTIRILTPWFEKSAGLEIELHNEGKIIYPCQWEGHGLQFEAEEVMECVSRGRIASDLMPHFFSKMMISVMDEVRRQIKVTYDLYE